MADIKVLTTTNMMPILNAVAAGFENASGHKLTLDHAGATPVKNRIAGGEVTDVVIHSRPTLDALSETGCIKAASVVDFARIPVALAVRAGMPRPLIASKKDFTHTLLAAGSVAYPDPAGGSLGGIFCASLLEQLGIAGQIRPKTKLTGPAAAAAELVAQGGADMVVDQVAQLRQVAGLDVVLLPHDLGAFIAMAAALVCAGRQVDAASAFIGFLASPAAAPMIAAKGMAMA